MLDLDEQIFSAPDRSPSILKIKRLLILDVAQDRHWQKIYAKDPALVMGFDISAGMLHQLKRKYPNAIIQLTEDNLLKTVDGFFCRLSDHDPYHCPYKKY